MVNSGIKNGGFLLRKERVVQVLQERDVLQYRVLRVFPAEPLERKIAILFLPTNN